MMQCKNCNSHKTVKNGALRDKQRYKCNFCGYNFVSGDMRIKRSTELKRITCVLLYPLGKSSFRFLAKLFNVSPATTYQWVRKTAVPSMTNPQMLSSQLYENQIETIPGELPLN